MKIKFLLVCLLCIISNCVPLAVEADRQSSESRGKDCINKKNTHLLLCQTAKLDVRLCFLTFPDCFEDVGSSGSSSSSE